MTVVYDVDGAIVTNCVVEFVATSFSNSTSVVNAISGGSAYNGTGTAADYGLAQSGSQRWKFSGSTDGITVPHGASIDNFCGGNTVTCELGFYVNSINQSAGMSLIDKSDHAGSTCGWYARIFSQTTTTGYLEIKRYGNTPATNY